MKIITLDDVKKLNLWETSGYDNFEIILNSVKNGYDLEVTRMYEYVDFSFDILMKLSELFGTKNINVEHFSESGCETCDFGSRYEITFNIRY